MDSAKKAVKNFLHKAGKNETDVQKTYAPAVKHENIERQQHEETTTVIDREIHQDHYHTTVQPIVDTEVLPEQHHYRVAPVEHREVEHGDLSDAQRRAHAEASQFQNGTTHTEGPSTNTTTSVSGTTHVHHHVHETIQPVLEKRVIERHIVHTTVPVHETHHNPPQHHDASTLPVVSLDEFQRNNAALTDHDRDAPQTSGGPLASGGVAQNTQTGQTGTNAGVARSVNTGVAGNAAISAARAAAMGQRSA